MASRRQMRVWRYVEEGSLLKLKSYLKKHSGIDLSFSQGRRRRSPLHLACCRGDDAVLRLLLKHGAVVSLKDRKGDTALHTAAKRTLKHGKIAYDDLVVPLQKNCPEAMYVSNKAGLTPEDLLNRSHSVPMASTSHGLYMDPDWEWIEKLTDAYEDEFYSHFGVDDFPDEDEEDFGDWADRIREEYFGKKNAQRFASSSCSGSKRRKTKEEREQEEKCHREHLKNLQREHEEYLSRATQKQDEVRLGKKRRYEERCAATFQASSAADTKLSYNDIPWPAPRGSVHEMVEVMLHGVNKKDTVTFSKILKKQQILWHPDKFAQRCAARLVEEDRQRILDTVTALSQELNRLAQSLKT